jgi:hypothetical protein
MKKLEKLARIISQVHALSYPPFYAVDDSDFWDELKEVTESKEDVDKKFFLSISKFISDTILDNPKGTVEKLAIALSRIHSHRLVPFYFENESTVKSNLPDWDGYNWHTLRQNTTNDEEVSQLFFREMAASIIEEINEA